MFHSNPKQKLPEEMHLNRHIIIMVTFIKIFLTIITVTSNKLFMISTTQTL